MQMVVGIYRVYMEEAEGWWKSWLQMRADRRRRWGFSGTNRWASG